MEWKGKSVDVKLILQSHSAALARCLTLSFFDVVWQPRTSLLSSFQFWVKLIFSSSCFLQTRSSWRRHARSSSGWRRKRGSRWRRWGISCRTQSKPWRRRRRNWCKSCPVARLLPSPWCRFVCRWRLHCRCRWEFAGCVCERWNLCTGVSRCVIWYVIPWQGCCCHLIAGGLSLCAGVTCEFCRLRVLRSSCEQMGVVFFSWVSHAKAPAINLLHVCGRNLCQCVAWSLVCLMFECGGLFCGKAAVAF